jgi:hypothetical protein
MRRVLIYLAAQPMQEGHEQSLPTSLKKLAIGKEELQDGRYDRSRYKKR